MAKFWVQMQKWLETQKMSHPGNNPGQDNQTSLFLAFEVKASQHPFLLSAVTTKPCIFGEFGPWCSFATPVLGCFWVFKALEGILQFEEVSYFCFRWLNWWFTVAFCFVRSAVSKETVIFQSTLSTTMVSQLVASPTFKQCGKGKLGYGCSRTILLDFHCVGCQSLSCKESK